MRFLILGFFFFSGIYLYAQNAAETYISTYDSLAIEVMNTYGIPASLVLGIALQESGAGTSKLCRTKHNHFGVKGRVKSSKTKSGYATIYRKFDSDSAAYYYFGEMISTKKYYSSLKGNLNYMNWLKAMKAARYATSSQWISRVDNFIKRYDLTCYDLPATSMETPVSILPDSIVILKQ